MINNSTSSNSNETYSSKSMKASVDLLNSIIETRCTNTNNDGGGGGGGDNKQKINTKKLGILINFHKFFLLTLNFVTL